MGIIYKITNKVNGKIYIGQTVKSEPQRWQQHLWYSNNNKDNQDCPYLCNAIRKYGKENFLREILEEIPNELLDKREIYWITFYNSTNPDIGYNLNLGGCGHQKFLDKEILAIYIKNNNNLTKTAQELCCDRNNLAIRLQRLGIKTNNYIGVDLYNLNKEKIKHFDTKQEASLFLNCHISCFENKSHYINGYFYIKDNEDLSIDEIVSNLNPKIKNFQMIEQYDFLGKYINTFKNAAEASKVTGINISSIKNCSSLTGNQKTAGGYLWRRSFGDLSYEEMMNRFLLSSCCSEVDEIDKDGNILKTYPSSTSIEKENSWSRNSVKKVCDGKQKATHNRFFQYHNPLKRELIKQLNMKVG